MEHENRQRVVPLDELNDMKVADEDPDVRGWDVISADGRKFGKVEELLVDTSAMKVRYLDVEVEKDLRASDRDRRILIPVGHARLHESEDHVHVSGLSTEQVRSIPPYTGRLDRQYEDSIRSHFGGAAGTTGAATTSSGKDYYDDRHFDDNNFYGARRGTGRGTGTHQGRTDRDRVTLSEEELEVNRQRHQAGEVRVGKHVETEHVERDVPVMREEVEVERRPIQAGERTGSKPTFENDEIRVPVMEEEVSVHKRAVPKEEIIVKKRQVEDTKHVEADLRREHVDVEGEGNVRRKDSTDSTDRTGR
jgi:uncharacterized protein (TIGR02271 family)